MKIYGVMVIGCGYIGLQHLEDIYYRENIRLIAVADTDERAANRAARSSVSATAIKRIFSR